MGKKWFTSLLAVLFVLSLALTGCSSSSSSGGSAGDSKQELTYATTSKVVGLSPILTNDSVSSTIIEQIYETLFVRDNKGEIVPHLAESYENPDENTWVIKLKKDIKFHDGTPFNAEAVKYTFDKLKDPATAAPRASLLEPVSSIEVQDEHTVVLKTEKPYGPMLAALTHSNAAIVSPTADKKQDLMKDPVGTGPFKFSEKVNGDDIVLVKNEDYWQKPAKLDKITFTVVPEVSTAISMLQTGKVQLIDGLAPELMPRLEKIKNVETQKVDGTPVYYLAFNMERALMNDLKFRQAVAHAINREGYLKKLNGLGVYSNTFIGPEVFGHPEEEKGPKYDQAKAKELVKANGLEQKEVKMLVPNTASYMNMAEVIQAQLKEAGIPVKIETLEWGTYLDVSKKGDFDITIAGWSNVTGDGSELLFPRLHSANIDATNLSRYKDAELDKLIEQSRSVVDQEQRKEILTKADEYVMTQLPVLPIYHGIASAAYDKSVKGFTMEPTGQWSLYSVHRE
ncbi:glutathione ABC transporter substrate-binding protein [Fictibacillus phosphorivorans]|uniref:glutathione ABC transporter substrate-binding protein n=1 Tax=Fictibacillus phosphorivorans TaxID=1221500 RepID=UPI00203E7E02|nr:glutathione ABC transporter substrate-binding protein [Fictibacillus phosphorivorans]MCM3717598.1 glutathione ABC transporter substrate-binding protein [Fictibacillus phosphorivorans]MCM3775498.1 glutathione ABC transporter substrate-binding protein [Fictibacillus phosphorivorans]